MPFLAVVSGLAALCLAAPRSPGDSEKKQGRQGQANTSTGTFNVEWSKLRFRICQIISKFHFKSCGYSRAFSTFNDGWPLLLAPMCGTVLLEGPCVEELSAAGEEGLLFFLGVCCQHLFGQSQALVGLLLLAGR